MDCIVPKDPNMDINWRRGVGGDINSTVNIAYARQVQLKMDIFTLTSNNKHITKNYTKSWNTTVSLFTITISNITAEDSSVYKCDTYNNLSQISVVV